jgi:hypothetical protein
MTMARSQLVDVFVTRWHHCITRCVRRAFLVAAGPLDRKEWIELRLKDLAQTVDFTCRLFRDGKSTAPFTVLRPPATHHPPLATPNAISAELTGILERLGTSAERWQARLEKLKGGRLLGRFFAATRGRLREVAARMKVHHLANLGGCPTV